MAGHISVQGDKLCVFRGNLFESYEVAALLGYTQHSSLRKQTFTSWQHDMAPGEDYQWIRQEDAIREYEALYAEVHGASLVPVKPKRGRLFFTPQGIQKVLTRSTKPTAALEDALKEAGFLAASVPTQAAPQKTTAPTLPSREERLFEYEIMQTLISQLERLTDDDLRYLAITAAETALGRKVSFPKKSPKPIPEGPLFTELDFYSMTRIGEKAGGYTARQAGLAVDIVASRRGYTGQQVRTQQLTINEIVLRPDTTTGKKRPMVRFARDFSNQVIHELRSNPKFQPAPAAQSPFIERRGPYIYPTLSRGVFEDDEDSTPTRRPV